LHRSWPARGYKTIGWVGRGRLQHDLVRVVEEQTRGARFVDATDLVDAIKAIKSLRKSR
jgi:hypothetical protein